MFSILSFVLLYVINFHTIFIVYLSGSEIKLAGRDLRESVKRLKKVEVEKIFIRNSTIPGAVCLDGSPPGYHYRRGYGSGSNKWIVFFNGGAWCYDKEACYQRSHSIYGSTYFDQSFSFSGLYSNDPDRNPHFYNWNMIFVIYCDGSSFTGLRTKPVFFMKTAVYFRGKAILDAVIEDLLKQGIWNASEVILSGSSAGSLTVLIHADYIKTRLNPDSKIRAISDSGYFVDMPTQHGAWKARKMFRDMLTTHNSTQSLNKQCLKRYRSSQHWKCLFPEYFFDLINIPVFVLQSAYDVWQMVNNLDVVCTVPKYKDILIFHNLRTLKKTRKKHARRLPSRVAYTKSRVTNIWTPKKKVHTRHAYHVGDSLSGTHLSRGHDTRILNTFVQTKSGIKKSLKRHNSSLRTKNNSKSLLYNSPLPLHYSTFFTNTARTRVKRKSDHTRDVGSKEMFLHKDKPWHWQLLYTVPPSCTKEEMKEILQLRNISLVALKPVITNTSSGLFLTSCFEHSQASIDKNWQTTTINGKYMKDAFTDWYFDKPTEHKHIGQQYDFESCSS